MIKESLKQQISAKPLQVQTELPSLAMFDNPPVYTLGVGYSSDMQMPVLNCTIPYQIQYIPDYSGMIMFSASVSYSEFTDNLIISYTKSENWLIFSSSETITYTQYIQEDAYTQVFYFVEYDKLGTYDYQLVNWGTENLNALGLGAYNAGPEQFRLTCGDTYLAQEEIGVGLFAAYKISFSSKEGKESFNFYMGASVLGGMMSGFGQIQEAANASGTEGYFEFVLYQVGGDETGLSKIMSKASGNQFYTVGCDFKTLSDCSGFINAILDYSANDFPKQVGIANDMPYGNVVSRGFVAGNYSGLNLGNSTVNPIAASELEALGNMYQTMKSQTKQVNELFASTSAAYLLPSVNLTLNNFMASSSYNKQLMQDPVSGVMSCYLQPKECLNIVTNLNANLEPINATAINNILDDFSYAFSGSISPAFSTNVLFIPIGDNYYFAANATMGFVMERPNIEMIGTSTLNLSYLQNEILLQQSTSGSSSSASKLIADVASIMLNQNSNGEFEGSFPCHWVDLCSGQVTGETCNVQLSMLEN